MRVKFRRSHHILRGQYYDVTVDSKTKAELTWTQRGSFVACYFPHNKSWFLGEITCKEAKRLCATIILNDIILM